MKNRVASVGESGNSFGFLVFYTCCLTQENEAKTNNRDQGDMMKHYGYVLRHVWLTMLEEI